MILLEKKLILSLDSLIRELKNKSQQFNKIIKIGRTHTQDATPYYSWTRIFRIP